MLDKIKKIQGQASGEAFIQFDGEQSSFNATVHKNGKCLFFGNKKFFIEVLQCSGEEMNLVLMGIYPSNLSNIPQQQSPSHFFNNNFSSSMYKKETIKTSEKNI